MDIFSEIVNNPQTKNTWCRWVATSDRPSAASSREFLSTCFLKLPPNKRNGLLKKLRQGDHYEVEAKVYELVAHELLWRLNLDPEWAPSVGNFTPDLTFQSCHTRFIADVFVSHSPSKTVENYGDGTGMARDTSEPSESRAKKIADRIVEKASKYESLHQPLVLFGFLGDHDILSSLHFEKALYGRTADEAEPGEYFPDVGRAPILLGGILLPRDDDKMPFANLSALVVLDWFDTLDRNDPGKRLHCLVLHHWVPSTPLPVNTFEPFCQLTWEGGGLRWIPQYTKDPKIVAKFCSNGEINFHPYSANTHLARIDHR